MAPLRLDTRSLLVDYHLFNHNYLHLISHFLSFFHFVHNSKKKKLFLNILHSSSPPYKEQKGDKGSKQSKIIK